METAHEKRTDRYGALDSLRGICALCVAVFHLWSSSQADFWPFFVNSWLFVDFFFVLSGFVIAASYGERIAKGFSLRDFMLLRFGRIYPLHAFVLAAMVALELLGVFLSARGALDRAAFDGAKSVPALLGSLGMAHIFGFWPYLVWNRPSWSIAAEMWAYAIFAVVCRFGGHHRVSIMLGISLVSLAALVLWGDPWLSQTFKMSLPRCLFGFGLGVLALSLHSAGTDRKLPRGLATLIECCTVLACLVFVSSVGNGAATLLAPFVFMASVLVFAREGGAVSTLLLTGPFALLGQLSYSIYMTHAFLLGRISDVYQIVQGRFGLTLLGACVRKESGDCFVDSGTVGVITPVLYVTLLILGSYICWRLVEEPGRRLSRKLVLGSLTDQQTSSTERSADARNA